VTERVFNAKLQTVGGKNIAYIVIPFSVEQVFQKKGRVPVSGSIDKVIFRSSVFPAAGMLKQPGMAGKHFLVVNAEMRKALGKHPGRSVKVSIKLDTRKRTVNMPSELKRRLASEGLLNVFNPLPYTQRKEYVAWVVQAQKPETRERRVQMILGSMKRRQIRSASSVMKTKPTVKARRSSTARRKK
jgi:Domain of unknown function (DUF1905)/Bacteriocin-protection, YdeI or OmpD-Associated